MSLPSVIFISISKSVSWWPRINRHDKLNSIVLWKRRTRRNNWKNERFCIVAATFICSLMKKYSSAMFTTLYGEESILYLRKNTYTVTFLSHHFTPTKPDNDNFDMSFLTTTTERFSFLLRYILWEEHMCYPPYPINKSGLVQNPSDINSLHAQLCEMGTCVTPYSKLRKQMI